ncbi:TetR/AcrR family transcriptional regulator [Streptomyces subrutilus]|uniref:TetR family transcriptional regulator n=1 Tax=Streptomyces subrutilus TaxID=36818 RepID=A0A5P2UTP3_9ACTN|nr:TetR/AcrR family transcriptional regulator [Streptomyces subrutilus]QEU82493.1 TetR/AcrR family transcriptional regulator [Streptomyces subrutilus]WSJ28032.1 TetR/AcrR family transcriptional regulator [Streptomyces subrutilus]GGZ81593.1 TetR family transcriptional regulator [Streptomyces subrutilus]
MEIDRSAPAESNRDRIIAAAAALLAEGGRESVSTRAVSAAAGVQAPTIYRLFGDKQGLLDEVAAHGFAAHLSEKAVLEPSGDPVEDLRAGWDLNTAFGLANPALYALMYGEPRPGSLPPAASAALEILGAHIHRIAEAGRLVVDEERAARLVHAVGGGTTLALIATPEEHRDLGVSRLAREAVISAITTDAPLGAPPGPAAAAIALQALLPQAPALTPGERLLLTELLDRITREGPPEG